MKNCSACKQSLSLDKFGKNKSERDGLMRQCKTCNNKRVSAYYTTDASKQAEWYKNRRYTRKGITLEIFEAKLAEQGGGCGICGELRPKMVADHDHACCPGLDACGECFRGVLCDSCNIGIAKFNDEVSRLLKAVTYLS